MCTVLAQRCWPAVLVERGSHVLIIPVRLVAYNKNSPTFLYGELFSLVLVVDRNVIGIVVVNALALFRELDYFEYATSELVFGDMVLVPCVTF